ncbi:MAG: alpha/beta fold hydrolase [Methyloligellaceae bacterium]
MTSHATAAACTETVAETGPDAPWITMVHGVSQDRRVFSAQVAEFKAGFRLLLVDLPGHGLSSDLSGPYGLQEFAASIQAAVSDAGVEKSHFWGTHIGAGAGLLLACREPGLFRSLVLEGPIFPGRALPAVSELLARIAATAREEGIDAARHLWWEEGGWFAVMRAHPDTCRAAGQRAMIAEFQGQPWLDAGLVSAFAPIDDALAGLQVPTLIMNGEHDLSEFKGIAHELTALLPRCRRTVIAEAGGFPLWEFPDRVNAEVRRFFDLI